MLRTKATRVALIAAILSTAASSALADPPGHEPLNDTMPVFGTTPAVVMFEKFSGEVSTGFEIGSRTDNDYYVIACPTSEMKLLGVSVGFSHARGDLDIALWKLNQNAKPTLLGISQGTKDQEDITIWDADLGTAVLQVYGWNGAQGPYNVAVYCRSPHLQ